MRRPLYSVTAGELESDLQSVEKSLAKVLDLAARWKSVLLLDEADVFLEQRSSSDLERNKLVTGKVHVFFVISLSEVYPQT